MKKAIKQTLLAFSLTAIVLSLSTYTAKQFGEPIRAKVSTFINGKPTEKPTYKTKKKEATLSPSLDATPRPSGGVGVEKAAKKRVKEFVLENIKTDFVGPFLNPAQTDKGHALVFPPIVVEVPKEQPSSRPVNKPSSRPSSRPTK